MLAAFRIWTVINYFFPYKDLMGEDWDGVLREYIPHLEQAATPLEYHLAVAEMYTHIHDTHGFVYSEVLEEQFGCSSLPIRVQMIEGLPVVTCMVNEEAVRTAGICIGDVILKIDGQDMLERITDVAKYRTGSTTASVLYFAANGSLRGAQESPATLTIRDREDCVREVQLIRKDAYNFPPERGGDVVRLAAEGIGYADLNRLEVPQVDAMFEQFKDTKAIIFDMRGYPRGTAWAIAPRLTDRNGVPAARFDCPLVLYPDEISGEVASRPSSYTFVQYIPWSGNWRYQGKTVMLIDERALSQAEHTGLFFESANGTKFIGSNTAGANGDVTNFFVPGGIQLMFTGQSVCHVDGRQLQRIGLVPEVKVHPTIQGLREGRDEVLEAAIRYLQETESRPPSG
jgi:C-terminal processing protease CtpA/Prc